MLSILALNNIGDVYLIEEETLFILKRSSIKRNNIFIKGAYKELFSPKNSLLLYRNIKYALEKGFIIIIPNINLELVDLDFPLRDKHFTRILGYIKEIRYNIEIKLSGEESYIKLKIEGVDIGEFEKDPEETEDEKEAEDEEDDKQ
ncbi:unnamed protein product [Fusarium graminearum]|nr:unnamed protein product [Fusarium graminearum]